MWLRQPGCLQLVLEPSPAGMGGACDISNRSSRFQLLWLVQWEYLSGLAGAHCCSRLFSIPCSQGSSPGCFLAGMGATRQ